MKILGCILPGVGLMEFDKPYKIKYKNRKHIQIKLIVE